MTKCNNKSIRLTDRVYNYIINYRGDGFNQKFENIIIDAMESEKKRNKEIHSLDDCINDRRIELDNLNKKLMKLNKIDFKMQHIINIVNELSEEVLNDD